MARLFTNIPNRFICVLSRLAILVAALGLMREVVACQEINGGAAEFSWSLRTFSGASIADCEMANVAKVQLCWSAVDSGVTGCRPGTSREFNCKDVTGVTRFDIAPGPTAFSIQPICSDGLPARAGTFQVPAEIVRTVRNGVVVSLDALLIVVTEFLATCGPECTCVRP